PVFRDGTWQLLEARAAWEGNDSNTSFIAFSWAISNYRMAMVVVNYAAYAGQCYIRLPWEELKDQALRFRDLMSSAMYDREGNKILSEGLYLDIPAWGYHIFEVSIPANIFLPKPARTDIANLIQPHPLIMPEKIRDLRNVEE